MSEEIQHRENAEEKRVDALEEEVEILEEEVIDLEEWAKANRKPRRAKRYRIRIDKEYKEVTVHSMTGREILELVGKTPEKYMLSEKLRGGRIEPIKPDQVVEFHRHEVERFQTLALDPTEG
jgi:plasmid stabilization system protein ParE